MPIPYFGCPCLRVVTASQWVGPRLAWAWEGGGCLGPSQEGRKRPQALLDRGMATLHLCAPCCPWLTAQAILRCRARGNPGLSGGEGGDWGGGGGVPSTLQHSPYPRSPCSEDPSFWWPHALAGV